jgi:hypothetical protein
MLGRLAIKGVVAIYKASKKAFQAPFLKLFIPNVDKIKDARPHISTLSILHIFHERGA